MTTSPSNRDAYSGSRFDSYAGNYHNALERGLKLSGESSAYFAEARCRILGERMAVLGAPAVEVLDFGCGTGSTTPYLLSLPGARRLLGVDSSSALLEVARRDHQSPNVDFAAMVDVPARSFDVAYCNGVFHHIEPADRGSAVECVRDALRPGGLFALWENNPWNPGTRLIMHRIEFDRGAQPLSAPATRRMLETAGFDVVLTEFAFIFPSFLRALRRWERHLARIPIGGQYMVLARKRH